MIRRVYNFVADLVGWIVLAIFLLVVLSSCGDGGNNQGGTSQDYGEVTVITINAGGTTVYCAVLDEYEAGGITCDWAALHQDEETF